MTRTARAHKRGGLDHFCRRIGRLAVRVIANGLIQGDPALVLADSFTGKLGARQAERP
jgi:hypothetical protein